MATGKRASSGSSGAKPKKHRANPLRYAVSIDRMRDARKYRMKRSAVSAMNAAMERLNQEVVDNAVLLFESTHFGARLKGNPIISERDVASALNQIEGLKLRESVRGLAAKYVSKFASRK